MRTLINKASLVLIFFSLAITLFSQDKVKLYDPSLDGMKQIKEAVSKAKSQGKHVLIQYGKVLHIQDSALLEEGKGYNQLKVQGFFRNWTTSAIIPAKPK